MLRRHVLTIAALLIAVAATAAWLWERSAGADLERRHAALCLRGAATLDAVGEDLKPGSLLIAEMGEHGWFFAQGRVSAAGDVVEFCLPEGDASARLQDIRTAIMAHDGHEAVRMLRELANRIRERTVG